MRVATFNILNGRSPDDGRVDVARFADAVRGLGADVLGLQEVDRNLARSHHADLTAVAAEAMGATEHRFVPALAGSPESDWVAATGDEPPGSAGYGIGFLSRHPVTGWEVVRLRPVPVRAPVLFPGSRRPVLVRDEPRVAVVAAVRTPYGEVTFAHTHLSFIPWWNGRQLRHLVGRVRHHARPLVLMGDLNMGPARAARLTGMRPLATHRTFPAWQPSRQLDHVLVDGALPGGASGAPRLPLSDHRALYVDLGPW